MCVPPVGQPRWSWGPRAHCEQTCAAQDWFLVQIRTLNATAVACRSGQLTHFGSATGMPRLNQSAPIDYGTTLSAIKQRLQQWRVRAVLAVNSAMVLLYWDIGKLILERQSREGWGAKIIDRLARDLRKSFPDMQGFSSRN